MAYRRSLEDDAETANQNQDQSPDVEGHAFKSGRLAGEPDRSGTETTVQEDDVEGHAVRVKADGAAGPESAVADVAAGEDDVEGHAFKSGR
jgi:hypothetical protein